MKPNKAFPITSVSINDIIELIEDNNSTDDLQKAILIRKANELTNNQMKAIAENMCDNYVENYFWGDLSYWFKRILEEK